VHQGKRQGNQTMLIVMAGLPGTGKSTLAERLADKLGAVVLNMDQVRAALFPPPVLDYSTAQDDICMAAIYHAAASIFKASPQQVVIIDGRTFLRSSQLQELLTGVASLNEVPRLIECVCAAEVARARLEHDLARGEHPARNRTYALYRAVRVRAEPVQLPHLVLDTGVLPLAECVERSLVHLRGS
jgi:adenylylsulfate kinase